MKTFICTVATILMATISFFAFHSVNTPEDNQVVTCGKDTIAIEVDTLSPKATEMDSKPTTIPLAKPLSIMEITTSKDNTESANTLTRSTTTVNTTSLVETIPQVEIMESIEVIVSTENTESTKSTMSIKPTTIVETMTSTEATTSTESELTTVTTTVISSYEATSSSVTTTDHNIMVYKTLTISDTIQTDVIPGTILQLLLINSENHYFTSEAEVAENGYVTFVFQSDDDHLITSGKYKCYCPELGTEKNISLD